MQFKPAVTVLVTAIALASLLSGCSKKEEAAPAPPPPQVGVVTLKTQAYTLTSELPGRTTAFRIAEVRPQVNGIILKRLFKEGGDVKAGQQLYQIDPAIYQATLNSAEATCDPPTPWPAAISSWSMSKRSAARNTTRRWFGSRSEGGAAERQKSTCVTPRSMRRSPAALAAPSVTEGALVSNGQTDAMAHHPAARPDLRRRDPVFS